LPRFAVDLELSANRLAIEFVTMLKNWIVSLVLVTTASLALAQFDTPGQNGPSLNVPADKIPAAALLTQRGQELAERLRQLRRIEATMGARHPSRTEVQAEIKAVIEQLHAWSPSLIAPSGEEPLADALPAMNQQDLNQLILRLSAKVNQLESRVEALEKQRQASP
jgi:hypothetical protein